MSLLAPGAADHEPGQWSVIVPYFNEEAYLVATLRSLAAQSVRPLTLILVDNASTDGSGALARATLPGDEGLRLRHVFEPRPGKIHALAAGLREVDTEFVATCDADTHYPPDYLEIAGRILARGSDIAAALAWGCRGAPHSRQHRFARAKGMVAAALMPRQCHSGGYGQCFRTLALHEAGGFSAELWPFVLEDHEIMHRIAKIGRLGYARDFWCVPSDRRADRRAVDWTLAERLLYHLTPFEEKDWLFYRFLARRFAARKMSAQALREKSWQAAPMDGASKPETAEPSERTT